MRTLRTSTGAHTSSYPVKLWPLGACTWVLAGYMFIQLAFKGSWVGRKRLRHAGAHLNLVIFGAVAQNEFRPG